MRDQKGFSTNIKVYAAVVTLLSCCSPASSFLFPRVTRTSDATIIDYTGVGYASPFLHQGKNYYGDIANSKGFIPVSSFNPYAMTYRQQQPIIFNGWPYSYGQQSLITPAAGVLPHRQLADVLEQQGVNQLDIALKQGVTAATTTKPPTTPAIQCGLGPATMPAARSSISERLAGGVNAKKNAWPFTVLVANSIGLGQQSCAGVLISDTQVLLAAQCLERLPLFYTMLMTVSVGMHSINPFDAPMTRRVSNIVLHGQFNAATFANDIAIITLDAPVVLSRTVAPVCLPPASADPDQYVGQDAIVLGWDASNVLQQGKAQIALNQECKNLQSISQYVSETTLCLSSTSVFTCIGDIGGPVVIKSSTGAWTVVGINSYTPADCSSNGLKTRVSAFRAWIDKYMK